MDISYLLFLQDIRNSLHDAGTSFFVGLSTFSVTYLFLLPAFAYWCINKRKGLYVFASAYLCIAMSAIVKLIACVYRPWVRDPRVIPVGDSLTRATGYSLPSGHVTHATPIYVGMAQISWAGKFTRWISVLFIAALLLTAFSRNYLGVHTLQDVCAGFALGLLALWMISCVFKDVQQHPEHENYFLLAGVVFGILNLLFVIYKPYPLDYINGKLLVDPKLMTNDAYKDISYLIAFCAARYTERRWVSFEQTGLSLKGVLISVIGLIPAALLISSGEKLCLALLGAHWGRCLYAFVIVFYLIAGFPAIIKFVFQQKKK